MTMSSARTARLDPVPTPLLDAVRDGLPRATVGADLAELAFDSVLAPRAADAGDAASSSRALTFEAPGIAVHLVVSAAGRRRHLVGWTGFVATADVEVLDREGMWTTTADEAGRFVVDDVVAGPVSVRLLPSGGRAVETEWVIL